MMMMMMMPHSVPLLLQVECTLVASLCQYTATGSSAWVLMLAVHHVSQMASPHKPPRFFTLPVSAACAIGVWGGGGGGRGVRVSE